MHQDQTLETAAKEFAQGITRKIQSGQFRLEQISLNDLLRFRFIIEHYYQGKNQMAMFADKMLKDKRKEERRKNQTLEPAAKEFAQGIARKIQSGEFRLEQISLNDLLRFRFIIGHYNQGQYQMVMLADYMIEDKRREEKSKKYEAMKKKYEEIEKKYEQREKKQEQRKKEKERKKEYEQRKKEERDKIVASIRKKKPSTSQQKQKTDEKWGWLKFLGDHFLQKSPESPRKREKYLPLSSSEQQYSPKALLSFQSGQEKNK